MPTFAVPSMLPWTLLILALAWLFWHKLRWQEAVLHRWYKSRARQPRHLRFRRWFRLLRSVFFLGALAGLWFALARPLRQGPSSSGNQQGLDLIVLLDISASMKRKDIPPSRWQQAMLALEMLHKNPSRDRIAFIAFAGEAGIQCPWTEDRVALQELAWQSKPGIFAEQGDGLTAALETAHRLFSRPQPRPAPRAILLLSDGFSSTKYRDAVRSLKALGVQWLIASIAQPNAPNGSDGWTSLHLQGLKDLASYVSTSPISLSNNNLDELTTALQRIPRTVRSSSEKTQANELFYYPLSFGLLMLLAFLALSLLPTREIA
ncbi:MAG: VWA domain-containing protein [Myxococcales bacterium]|nr:VWA domain-containing protein [Myxococcales bacterium]